MILDQLTHAHLYYKMHKSFKEAFEFILAQSQQPFKAERLHLIDDELIAILEAPEIKGRSAAKLEAHRKYIDIQYTFDGTEEIGWKSHHTCQNLSQAYNPEKDIEFFSDTPSIWLPIPTGSFAIFYPHDAHAPLAASKPVQKIIMKVAID